MALVTSLRQGNFGGVVFGIASCCVAAAAPVESVHAADVVELFTSQGCSACPPADKALERLARQPGVIALSFAVDYWDYLGWRDTFARPEFTRRQRDYAKARGDNAVFTPQAVLNGREAVIGGREGEIRDALAAMSAAGQSPDLAVSARLDGNRVVVSLPAAESRTEATVWIAAFRLPSTVEIAAGENSGRSVTYFNVVDRLQVVGLWTGEAETLELPRSDVAADGVAGLAVIVQAKTGGLPGPILGATRLDLSSGS